MITLSCVAYRMKADTQRQRGKSQMDEGLEKSLRQMLGICAAASSFIGMSAMRALAVTLSPDTYLPTLACALLIIVPCLIGCFFYQGATWISAVNGTNEYDRMDDEEKGSRGGAAPPTSSISGDANSVKHRGDDDIKERGVSDEVNDVDGQCADGDDDSAPERRESAVAAASSSASVPSPINSLPPTPLEEAKPRSAEEHKRSASILSYSRPFLISFLLSAFNSISLTSAAIVQPAVRLVGPCKITDAGACATSPNYPDDYGNNERCTLINVPATPLEVLWFDVDQATPCSDYLTVNGTQYCDSGRRAWLQRTVSSPGTRVLPGSS